MRKIGLFPRYLEQIVDFMRILKILFFYHNMYHIITKVNLIYAKSIFFVLLFVWREINSDTDNNFLETLLLQ